MLEKILHKLTGRQHHYKILLRYTPDPRNGQTNVTSLRTLWIDDQRLIADERRIKKAMVGNMITSIPKQLRRNGNLEIAEVYYLGWFKPNPTRSRR